MTERDLIELSSDHELVELAAFAAGLTIRWSDGLGCYERYAGPLPEPLSQWLPWRPLSEDADALRLAVTLFLDVTQWRGIDDPPTVEVAGYEEKALAWEERGADPFAATRRAIVRAAAEIGRSMA